MAAVPPDLAFNTAVSFVTNTNWQAYGGETTMSYLTQMLGLAVQNFVSAASGMAVLVALIRGFARRESRTVGNFWVDLTRTTLYILLPLSLILAVALVSQGVVQTLQPYQKVTLLEPVKDADGKAVTEQTIARRAGRHRRSPSSNWAPTAAASSTPTPPIRWRIPRRCRISWRCWPSC